jgi:hypothetical protein
MFRRNRCSLPITIFFCTHAVAASLGCMQKRWIPRMLLFWCDHAHVSIRTVHAAPSSSWQVVHQSIKNTISTVEDRKERVCRCLIRHPDRFAVFDLDTAIQFGTREPRFSGPRTSIQWLRESIQWLRESIRQQSNSICRQGSKRSA